MNGSRQAKLNAEFKRYITEILTFKVKDPRITEIFTIISVDSDKALTSAKVYVSVFSADENKAAATFQAICDSEPYVRSQISRSMHIRTVPMFHFVQDTTMAHGQKIDIILKSVEKGGEEE